METQAVAAPIVPLIRWVALGAQPCEDEQRHRRLRKSALRQEDGSSPWRALPCPHRAPVLYAGYTWVLASAIAEWSHDTTVVIVVCVMVHSSIADVNCLRSIRCTSSTAQLASSSAKRASPLSMVRPDPAWPSPAIRGPSLPIDAVGSVASDCAEHRRFDRGHRTRVPCSPHALGGA